MARGKAKVGEDSEATGPADGLAATGRRVRLSLVLPFLALIALAGGALFVATDVFERERPPAPRPDRTAATAPPLRLDTLPAPRGAAREGDEPGGKAGTAPPVIGVGTGEFSAPAESEVAVEVDGHKPHADVASDAQIRRELAALARENARIERALAAGGGPATGTGDLAWPVRGGRVTSPFGQRWGRLHAGVDIGVGTGSNVYASDSGRVALSGVVGGYGNYICIQHTGSLSTCYAHNSRLGVRKGETVRKGAVIAKSGCTGRCYGPHVHFEVRVGGRPTNPMRYF